MFSHLYFLFTSFTAPFLYNQNQAIAMNSKGMSQTLALIVAASVLMMTALTVIFMVQGGLGDVNSDTSSSSCRGTIQAICSGTNANQDLPATCMDQEGNPIPSTETMSAVQGDTVVCQEVR
ncbi:MAG: hypothetical protein ACI8Z7_000069 [Candidatus Nanohaloarchaea archaeon]